MPGEATEQTTLTDETTGTPGRPTAADRAQPRPQLAAGTDPTQRGPIRPEPRPGPAPAAAEHRQSRVLSADTRERETERM